MIAIVSNKGNIKSIESFFWLSAGAPAAHIEMTGQTECGALVFIALLSFFTVYLNSALFSVIIGMTTTQ
jgi:hypothetical protein